MQGMVVPIEHLIESAQPAHCPGSAERARALVAPVFTCAVVDALAGDCRSPLGERLRQVEAECGFGQRCSRACDSHTLPGYGFAGDGRVSITQVALPAQPGQPGDKAGNDSGF